MHGACEMAPVPEKYGLYVQAQSISGPLQRLPFYFLSHSTARGCIHFLGYVTKISYPEEKHLTVN